MEEYWHIGETPIRLAKSTSRMRSLLNRCGMGQLSRFLNEEWRTRRGSTADFSGPPPRMSPFKPPYPETPCGQAAAAATMPTPWRRQALTDSRADAAATASVRERTQ